MIHEKTDPIHQLLGKKDSNKATDTGQRHQAQPHPPIVYAFPAGLLSTANKE